MLPTNYPYQESRPKAEAEPSRWNDNPGPGGDENSDAEERQTGYGDPNEL